VNKNKAFLVLSFILVLSMALTACQPAATQAPAAPATEAPAALAATEAPAATAAPAATEAPTAGPTAVPFVPVDPTKGPVDCSYGGLFKEMKAVDDLTVEFDLCAPDPAFPSKIAFSPFGIQPKEWIEKAMVDKQILEKPIGTGPYMIDSWKRGDSITFKRFDDYWGEKAKVPTLVFKWSTESAARLLELQSGTVDGIDNPAPEDFATIKADPSLQLLEREALNVFYIGMTNTFPPFDNVKVRQAIAMGIDRKRIVDNFYPAGSEVADYFTPCAIENGCVGDKWYDFDPVAAKKLLADAGFPDGFKTNLYYRDVVRGYLPQVTQVATDIQSQLKENLGIDAEITVMESGAFIDDASNGRLNGIHLLGWGADYPHITDFLDYHFGKSQKQFGTPFPEIYDNLVKGASMADAKAAEQYYVAANNAVKAMVPLIPVAHGGSGAAYRADVTGGQAAPLTNENFSVVTAGKRDTFVWMQGAEPISLYCGDETDGESLRACEQVTESLLSYEIGGTAVKPGLATSCDPNAELTVWTCHLRSGVKFHDGSTLDSGDVIESLMVQWDAANPLHIGNTGTFEYFSTLWQSLLNVPPTK
jgi:peptide/nickel transport system substrate-binding protein